MRQSSVAVTAAKAIKDAYKAQVAKRKRNALRYSCSQVLSSAAVAVASESVHIAAYAMC
jgi:hypothetical protein